MGTPNRSLAELRVQRFDAHQGVPGARLDVFDVQLLRLNLLMGYKSRRVSGGDERNCQQRNICLLYDDSCSCFCSGESLGYPR